MARRPGGLLFNAGSNILELLGLPGDTLPRSSEPSCSYCGKPLDPTTTTYGRGPMRKSIEQEPIWREGKVVGFEEKVKWNSSKLAACPDCCLNLVEKVITDEKGGVILNRAGEPMTSGVKTVFGDFD